MMPDAFPIFFAGRNPYPGQAIVMPEVVKGHNVLFAAPTASGKTEAAVTPLYQRHVSFKRRTLSTIYIAPTKALVNDLHERLTTYLGVRAPGSVARYTGDRHEFRVASGVFCVLVTPEALDSLQLRHPEMLADVRAIIIDEIHLLHGQARGQQLRHVIRRIERASAPAPSGLDGFQVVGMTATLDDMAGVAKEWLGSGAKVLSHGSPRDIELQLVNVDVVAGADPLRSRARSLARWLDQFTADKVLVFANSRNGAHALAAHLHHELAGTRWPVHLHFGALAASERERVEGEMRTKRYGVCVATTTLEIGIDIGDVDAVVLSDSPRSVSGFLQRIGRGNRRSGICRVVAFRSSDDDERLIRALVDCGQRGELDDVCEYRRPSVQFQQILSLCWRATRQDRPLSIGALAAEAGTEDHAPVIHDMIATGCLVNVHGALVPCDRLMDEADAGRIHSVIAGQPGNAVVDVRTGKPAIRDAERIDFGGALFHGGEMRRLMAGSDGEAYLGGKVAGGQPLARIRGTGFAPSMSRSIVWGLARQRGFNPTRWRLERAGIVTWGGETFNTLLAALLTRQSPARHFVPMPEGITGPVSMLDVSLDAVRELARATERADDLPLNIARKFTSPSRFLHELSNELAAEEVRRALPWVAFNRWLDRIEGIEDA